MKERAMRAPPADRDVLIRNRSDGVTELTPKLAPLDVGERWMIIVTVVIATWGFFLAGAMPAPIFAAVLSCCLAGELVLGAKYVLLLLLRPAADVVEVPRFSWDRRRR
jgi:hypothetical protein